jgi:hypothetical protein
LWEDLDRRRAGSLRLRAEFCDLGHAFIPKGQVGRHSRSISRSGLILLMNSMPSEKMQGSMADVHVSVWHRSILPQFPPEPYGVLLTLRPALRGVLHQRMEHTYIATLREASSPDFVLSLDVGGGRILVFERRKGIL